MLHSKATVGRMLNMFGGCTTLWGSLSNEAEIFAVEQTFGAKEAKSTGREATDYDGLIRSSRARGFIAKAELSGSAVRSLLR